MGHIGRFQRTVALRPKVAEGKKRRFGVRLRQNAVLNHVHDRNAAFMWSGGPQGSVGLRYRDTTAVSFFLDRETNPFTHPATRTAAAAGATGGLIGLRSKTNNHPMMPAAMTKSATPTLSL